MKDFNHIRTGISWPNVGYSQEHSILSVGDGFINPKAAAEKDGLLHIHFLSFCFFFVVVVCIQIVPGCDSILKIFVPVVIQSDLINMDWGVRLRRIRGLSIKRPRARRHRKDTMLYSQNKVEASP